MAQDSIRKQILAAVRARLEAITTANDFSTDAGAHIFMGVLPKLGPEDPDAVIAVVPQDFSPTPLGKVQLRIAGDWPIDVIAVANASENRDDPWMVIEDVLADIQRAMELEDRTFGGLVNPTEFESGAARIFGRESASEIVAVAQTYTFRLQRVWGCPELAR